MQAMRAELRLHPSFEFGPEARPVYDELIAKTPAAQGVTYDAATVGGVTGWWCRPSDAVDGAAILYLHGGAYILGSAAAYRNFAGQIAARAKAVTFIPDYKLAPEHQFPGAVDDALAAYRGLSAVGYSSLAGSFFALNRHRRIERRLSSSARCGSSDVSLDRFGSYRRQH
jgi:acetyl esterase/lipase